MDLFFDSSAIVPLILKEEYSSKAMTIWDQATNIFGWRWLVLEVESALARRQAGSKAWQNWHQISSTFRWLDLNPSSFNETSTFNRTLRLRAADAGHLFTYFKTFRSIPSLVFVSFDKEQVQAAKLLGLPILN